MKNKKILFLCLLPLSSLFFVSSCSKQSDYTQNLISNYQRVYPNGFDSDPIFVEKTGSYLDYFNNLNNDQKLDCLNFTLYNFILKNNLEVVAGFNLQSNDSLIKLYKSNKIDINLTINSYQFYKNASDDQNWHVNYLGTLEIKFLDNVNPFVSQDILLYAFAFSNFEFNPTDSSEPYWHNDKWTSSISTEVGFISYYKANTGYPYIMEPISEINSIRTTYGSGTYGVYLNFKIV